MKRFIFAVAVQTGHAQALRTQALELSSPPPNAATAIATSLDQANATDVGLESAQAQWHDARLSVAAEVAHQYLGLRIGQRRRQFARLLHSVTIFCALPLGGAFVGFAAPTKP